MKIKKLFLTLTLLVLFSVCALGATLSFSADEKVNGWYNTSNGKTKMTDVSGDTELDIKGNTSFGSSLTLNDDLMTNVYGEYDLTFTINADLKNNQEVWVSIVSIYDVDKEDALKTGIHFHDNGWFNLALYGKLNGQDLGYSVKVEDTTNFPSVSEAINVKMSVTYNEKGETVENLYMNDTLYLTANVTEIYDYYYVHTDTIGFDFYDDNEDVKITNVAVTPSTKEVNYRNTNINDFVYYGKATDFTAKRLTTTIDTTTEVFAYTQSEQINAGMFSNGKAHNYLAEATVKAFTAKEGGYEIGYYAWYKNIDNYVLLKTNGTKFIVSGVIDGVETLSKTIDYTLKANDAFSAVKKTTSDGVSTLAVSLGSSETIDFSGIEGITENYYVGVYGKNIKVDFSNIKTTSFYTPYDFNEMYNEELEKEWMVSGVNATAWDITGENAVVTLTNDYDGTVKKISVAVTTKVVNDPTAEYTMDFDIDTTGNFVFATVPYYNGDADYVLAGVESYNGGYKMFIKYADGIGEEKTITAINGKSLAVKREAGKFTLTYNGETLEKTFDGLTKISEYFGYGLAGNGTGTITKYTYDGFISFKKYEENGWIKTSVEKGDITFEGETIKINGDYLEAGLTADTKQQLAKVIKKENYTNDYVIDVDLTKIIEPSGQCQRLGVIPWYLDDENYFVVFVDQWTVWEAYQLNACGIYKGQRMLDSSFNNYEWFLGTLDTPGYINQTFHLKVVKNGQTIKGYLGGTLIFNRTFSKEEYDLTVYDNDDLYLGVFAAGIGAKFENYAIRAMQDGEGTPTPSAGNRPVVTLPKLATPNVEVSKSGLATWNSVENAVSYTYKINGGEEISTIDISVQLNDGDSIVVKAVADGKNYDDGDYSASKSFEQGGTSSQSSTTGKKKKSCGSDMLAEILFTIPALLGVAYVFTKKKF